MSDTDGWIKGKALQTVIGLRGIGVGDEVECSECKTSHIVWQVVDARTISVGTKALDMGTMNTNAITAWRPKQKEDQ